MKTTAKSLRPRPDEVAAPAQFFAVLVYEDDVAFERAEPLYRRLLNDFSQDTGFDCQFVNFHALSVPLVAADAATHAARADLVIFSCHAHCELPPAVTHWIETWLPHKSLADSALAALVGMPGENPGEVAALHDYLHAVANRGHMEFLPQGIAPPETLPLEPPPPAAPGENKTEIIWPIAEYGSWRHWGINE